MDNLPKKTRVVKEVKEIKVIKEVQQEAGVLFDPWATTLSKPLTPRPFKSPSGANRSATSSNQKNQQIINSKELDANQINYKKRKDSRRQQSTSSKERGANAISTVRNDRLIVDDAINSGHLSPLTSDDEEEIKPSHQDYSNIGHVDKDLPLPTKRSSKNEPFSPKNSRVPGFIEKWVEEWKEDLPDLQEPIDGFYKEGQLIPPVSRGHIDIRVESVNPHPGKEILQVWDSIDLNELISPFQKLYSIEIAQLYKQCGAVACATPQP